MDSQGLLVSEVCEQTMSLLWLMELYVTRDLNVVNIQKKSLGLHSEAWGRTFLADGPQCLHSLPLDSKPACLQEKVSAPSAHSGLW